MAAVVVVVAEAVELVAGGLGAAGGDVQGVILVEAEVGLLGQTAVLPLRYLRPHTVDDTEFVGDSAADVMDGLHGRCHIIRLHDDGLGGGCGAGG